MEGNVYKLTSDNSDLCYVGSTIYPIAYRLSAHKRNDNNCSSKILFENNANVSYELLETVTYTDIFDLRAREAHHIKNNHNCVNINIQSETKFENCETCNFTANKNSELERHYNTLKHKNNINPEKTINEYKCECGKTYSHRSTLFNHRKRKCCKKNNPNTILQGNNELVKLINELKLQVEELKSELKLKQDNNM